MRSGLGFAACAWLNYHIEMVLEDSYRHVIATLACSVACLTPLSAEAEVTWQGDFESGDTSQWSYILNAPGISVVDDVAIEGSHAGRIAINDSAEHIWSNGLNRVEFQYAHPAEETAEGADSYFGWSFMVPELLSEDDHQIGYYESDSTYQQVMSFPVAGDTIRFVTRHPQNQQHWLGSGVLRAGAWHDIVVHVHWSKEAETGAVDVWFDGEHVVADATAQTLADDNPHFVQLGILRDTISTEEVMYVDNARAGTTLEDVLGLASSSDPPAGAGGTSSGGADPGAGGTDLAATGGSHSSPASSGGAAPASDPDGEESSSSDSGGCAHAPGRSGPSAWLLVALAVIATVARTRPGRRSR